MAILRISTVFAQLANQLPQEEKLKLTKVFMLLTDNPHHPSLQLKKIQGAHRINVYECRLDQTWRIILQQISEMTFDLIYVGTHDEAIYYGAHLRENHDRYGPNRPFLSMVNSYLAGDDHALEFVSLSPGDFETWGDL
jgi:mRNA-degrading endonuclease YafQ of YafQ-DinJ toxin-antitoxin module